MKFWACWGYDDIYGGLHGMKEVGVYEGSEADAVKYAREMADNVISSYSDIYDSLEESVTEECAELCIDLESEEADDIRDEMYCSDMVYGCIELDLAKLPTLDIDELDKMYYDYEEEFIEKYRLE